ncbi:P-loop containing nucleoside triphosphate hydrolase protein [Nemania sp. NC0429]|nr:P-loop containing nucleoside triphosphate hydrolase protein [Nemania sp. NC0429]
METMVKALRHSNPMEARIALGDVPQAEPITAKNKRDQVQQIKKGIPEHANKRSAASDNRKLDMATRSFGLGNCIAKDGQWLIKGMQTPLMNHQVIGASWMLSREFCRKGPWGGILGDEMGMGKTLQALACIVSNKPSEKDLKTYIPTTLIVAPATSLKQWEEETKKHTDEGHIGELIQYKDIKKSTLRMLKSTEGVIFASYQDVSAQFLNKKFRIDLENQSISEKERKKIWDSNNGPLFQVPFWRVILDEAHNIKNRNTQVSIACQNLLGHNRWAMSGTPITNSLDGMMDLPSDGNITTWMDFVTRLRQVVAHPFLAESFMKKTLNKEDLLETRDLLGQISGQKPVFQRIGKWCAKEATPMNDDTTKQDDETTQNSFGKSEFGYKFNMDKQIDMAIASRQKGVCRKCYKEPADMHRAKCGHIFCGQCFDAHVEQELRNRRKIPRCPECKKPLTDYKPLKQSDADYSDVEDSGIVTPSPRPSMMQQRGQDYFKKHPNLERSVSKFLDKCDQDYPKPVVPSAKTVAVKEAIVAWQAEAPDDKIIVFTEFLMTSAILGRMLEAENIQFLYFSGNMSEVAKHNAIKAFHQKKGIKVMIASLRCGSVALNLTCANRVILVDLWWNLAIEMQAFSRVFRIGQTKETHFLRIIADDTIDNRIEALQEEKANNISGVLNSGETQNLSIEEIAALLGELKKSEDGSLEFLPYNEVNSTETEEA